MAATGLDPSHGKRSFSSLSSGRSLRLLLDLPGSISPVEDTPRVDLALTCARQCHLRVRTKREPSFLAIESIFQAPDLGAVRLDLQVQALRIAEFIGFFARLGISRSHVGQRHFGGILLQKLADAPKYAPCGNWLSRMASGSLWTTKIA